jgi:hypothetical protein
LTTNQSIIDSFNNKIKTFENFSDDLFFCSHDCFISSYSNRHKTLDIVATFYTKKDDGLMEEYGTSNILFTLSKNSSIFDKLKKKKNKIYGLYINENKLGVIFINKDKLDYEIEDNTVELAVIKTINLSYDEFKKLSKKS